MNLTLRDLIETYESMIVDLRVKIDQADQRTSSMSMKYQEAQSQLTKAIESIKSCSSSKHKELAEMYADRYPWRKR